MCLPGMEALNRPALEVQCWHGRVVWELALLVARHPDGWIQSGKHACVLQLTCTEERDLPWRKPAPDTNFQGCLLTCDMPLHPS